jgi:hypothetical protein
MGKARAPRKAFWEDLTKEVKQLINGGDQVVLMGDWNEDVREVQRKHLGPLGLVEPLVTKHGPVPTYISADQKQLTASFSPSLYK